MSDALYGRGLYVFVGLSSNAKSPTSDSTAATWSTKPLPGQRAFETDIGGGTKSEFNGDAWVQVELGGAIKAILDTLISGETSPDSELNSYLLTRQQCNKTPVAAAQTDFEVEPAAGHFYGLYVTASNGNITIKDGVGAVFVLTAPAIGPVDFGLHGNGLRFDTDITITTAASTSCIAYSRPE